MKRIDNRTVELTEREQFLHSRFEAELDNGWGVIEAAQRVQDTTEAVESIGGMGKTDPAFWAYLRDEDLT